MERRTITDIGYGHADCNMENSKVTDTTVVIERVIKEEPVDGNWAEPSDNVFNSHFVAVKQEVYSDTGGLKAETSSNARAMVTEEISVVHIKLEPSQAEANLHTETLNTHNSLLIERNTSSMKKCRRGLKQNIKTQTRRKPVHCLHCDYKSSTARLLKTHMKAHSDKKLNFVCDHCGYKCSYKGSLRTHMKAHNGDQPIACKHCDYKTYYKGSLRTHMKAHTGEKPFTCKYCDFKCSMLSTLKRHLTTHTGEKPYSCKLCNFKCGYSSSLKNHMSVHTGEKGYRCKHCEYRCSHPTNLKNHIRTHTGEKPYSCLHCGHKCAQSSSLRIHMKIHTGEKPFSCDYCEYKTARKHALVRHKIKIHFK